MKDTPDNYYGSMDQHDNMKFLYHVQLNQADPTIEDELEFNAYKEALIIISKRHYYDFWNEGDAQFPFSNIMAARAATIEEMKDLYTLVIKEMPYVNFTEYLMFSLNGEAQQGARFTDRTSALNYVGLRNNEMFDLYFNKMYEELGDEETTMQELYKARNTKGPGPSVKIIPRKYEYATFIQRNIRSLMQFRDMDLQANPQAFLNKLNNTHSLADVEKYGKDLMNVIILVTRVIEQDPEVWELMITTELSTDLKKTLNLKVLPALQAIELERAAQVPDIGLVISFIKDYLTKSDLIAQMIDFEYQERKKQRKRDDSEA